MARTAHLAVFEVLADRTSYAVLDACWSARSGRKPTVADLQAQLGPQTKRAIQRLADLQLIDVDTRCNVRGWDLWGVVQAARALPPGMAIFKFLTHPRRCDLVERLATGPVLRKDLNEGSESDVFISKRLGELRMMKLLRSAENEKTVRLEEREKVLWIFLAVDQALMDVHERALERHRRARTRHLKSSDWVREGDPRVRDTLPKQATSPAVREVAEVVYDPPGTYESGLEYEFEIARVVFPGHVRGVRLVGDYPATKVEIDVLGLDGSSVEVRRADLWSARFGLGPGVWRLPRPDLTMLKLGGWASDAVNEVHLSHLDTEAR